MGVAFALFLSAWLERCRCGLGGTLSMILLASALGGFLQLGLLGFSDKLTPVAAVAFPVLSLFLFHFGSRDDGTERDDAGTPGAEPLAVRSSILQIASILLCNIASGPASYGASVASDGGARSHAIVYFALSVALLFCGRFRKESLFSLLAIASLLCVAPLIVLSDPPGWLVGLVTADFWVVLLYSIAWFSSEGRRRGMLAAIGFRGIAAAYLLSSVSEIAGVALPGNMAYVGALVVVGMALAAALADLGRGGARGTAGEEGSTCSPPLASDGAVEELANRASLTDGERRVFECLSRGYSLRQVAVRLGITEGAAKYHRHNVYLKLGVSSREKLIALVERVAQTREA